MNAFGESPAALIHPTRGFQSQLAIYVVSFDYDLEKVVSSTRIPLRSVTSIQKGAYILSPLQEAGRDPEEVRSLQM